MSNGLCRLLGEPVNLREQHDALEFLSSLVDSLDEALKSLSKTPILAKVMGGSFADQKICKDCPHRYSREEPFTTLNVDIRNHQNLLESLEQYVKGDLLEGANAYHCEKCNKKVGQCGSLEKREIDDLVCNTVVIPVRSQWSFCSLAQSHQKCSHITVDTRKMLEKDFISRHHRLIMTMT